MTNDIKGRLSGPHEWGYRCLTEGTFIADNAPFEAADHITALERWKAARIIGARAAEEEVRRLDAALQSSSRREAAAVGALREIEAQRYGLQGLLEDGASEEDIQQYWANLVFQLQSIARSALQAVEQRDPNPEASEDV
jgi:hypothetical protein